MVDLVLDKQDYESLQEAFIGLRDALEKWNHAALAQGGVSRPFSEEVAVLNRRIKWGAGKLADPHRDEIRVRGISKASLRYAVTALLYRAQELRQVALERGKGGWPQRAVASIEATAQKIESLASNLEEKPLELLEEIAGPVASSHGSAAAATEMASDDSPAGPIEGAGDGGEAKLSPFISYARGDREIALRLYSDLKRRGYDPWLDVESLRPGAEWRPAISAAIRDCDCFVALLSKASVDKKGYVQKELREGLEVLDEVPPGDIFVIPVRIDDCKPRHARLNDLHWLDLFPDYEAGVERLCAALKGSGRRELIRDKAAAARDCERLLETMRQILELTLRRIVFTRSREKGHLLEESRQAEERLGHAVDRFNSLKEALELAGSDELRETLQGAAGFVVKTQLFGMASVLPDDPSPELNKAYAEWVQQVRPRFLRAAQRDFGLDPSTAD